eukprot:g865.t1
MSSDDEYSDSDVDDEIEVIEFLSAHLPKRKSRGRRYNQLLGEELEADAEFWEQDAWKQKKGETENRDNEYEYESMEDEFDSDYRSDREGEDDDDDGGENQKALEREERNRRKAERERKRKAVYKDPRLVMKKKKRKVSTLSSTSSSSLASSSTKRKKKVGIQLAGTNSREGGEIGRRKSKRSSAIRKVEESEKQRKKDAARTKKEREERQRKQKNKSNNNKSEAGSTTSDATMLSSLSATRGKVSFTQDILLERAAATHMRNRRYLQDLLRIEDEKKVSSLPRIKKVFQKSVCFKSTLLRENIDGEGRSLPTTTKHKSGVKLDKRRYRSYPINTLTFKGYDSFPQDTLFAFANKSQKKNSLRVGDKKAKQTL